MLFQRWNSGKWQLRDPSAKKVRTEGTREARPQVSCTRVSLLAGKAVKGSKSGSWQVLAWALGLRMKVRVVLKQERVRDSSHVLTKCQSPGLPPLAVISFLLPPQNSLVLSTPGGGSPGLAQDRL